MGEAFAIVDTAVGDPAVDGVVLAPDVVGRPTAPVGCVPSVMAVVVGAAVDPSAASLEVQNPTYGVTTLSWLGCAVL